MCHVAVVSFKLCEVNNKGAYTTLDGNGNEIVTKQKVYQVDR